MTTFDTISKFVNTMEFVGFGWFDALVMIRWAGQWSKETCAKTLQDVGDVVVDEIKCFDETWNLYNCYTNSYACFLFRDCWLPNSISFRWQVARFQSINQPQSGNNIDRFHI